MLLVGRNWTAGSEYTYGFNGKESDTEIYGEGNLYDYGFRIYSPSIGKFLSVDPLTKSYPELTPFQFASNTPIWAIDLDGLEAWKTTNSPEDVLTVKDWERFAVTELKRMEQEKITMDCADTWLYLIAKYHMINGVELTYYSESNQKMVSSNDLVWGDADEASFENFVWGMKDAGISTIGKYQQYASDGFLGAYSNNLLLEDAKEGQQVIATQAEDLKPGDALTFNSGIHTSISLNEVNLTTTEGGFSCEGGSILYATGSGYYAGKGEGNSDTGAPNCDPVEFRCGYKYLENTTILRPSFLEGIPQESDPQPIKTIQLSQIKL